MYQYKPSTPESQPPTSWTAAKWSTSLLVRKTTKESDNGAERREGDPENERRSMHHMTLRDDEIPRERNKLSVARHYFDLAISRAALISGAKVRRGSEILKNGC